MTRVSGFTETRTRHVWVVPTDSTDASAVIGEFQDAYAMAAQKCEELGIRSGSDDWLRIQPYGDTIRVWFETEKEDQPPTSKPGARTVVLVEFLDYTRLNGTADEYAAVRKAFDSYAARLKEVDES